VPPGFRLGAGSLPETKLPITRIFVRRSCFVAALLVVPLWAGRLSDDPPKVRPRAAASYDARDSHEGITIAAEAYDSDEKIKAAFGNHDPRKAGVLPVYVVFFNPSKDALRLDALEVTLQRGHNQFPQIAAIDVNRRLNGIKMPKGTNPVKIKAPLSAIVDQEFLLKMVPPGETAGGFLYFDRFSPPLSVGPDDTRLYLNKIQWAGSGRELLYFEIAFTDPNTDPNRKDTRKP
jgi:hypothetical protein